MSGFVAVEGKILTEGGDEEAVTIRPHQDVNRCCVWASNKEKLAMEILSTTINIPPVNELPDECTSRHCVFYR